MADKLFQMTGPATAKLLISSVCGHAAADRQTDRHTDARDHNTFLVVYEFFDSREVVTFSTSASGTLQKDTETWMRLMERSII